MSSDNETQSQSILFYISIFYDSEKFVLIYLLSSDSSIDFPLKSTKALFLKVHFKDCKDDCFHQSALIYISVLTEGHTAL